MYKIDRRGGGPKIVYFDGHVGSAPVKIDRGRWLTRPVDSSLSSDVKYCNKNIQGWFLFTIQWGGELYIY